MNAKNGQIMIQGLPKIARHFATSERTIRKWLAQGAPIVLIGRRYVAKPDEIWAWLIKNPVMKWCLILSFFPKKEKRNPINN